MSPPPRTSEAGRLSGDCSARREMALHVEPQSPLPRATKDGSCGRSGCQDATRQRFLARPALQRLRSPHCVVEAVSRAGRRFVLRGDGSAAAASVILALRDEKCRLPLLATSTTAELVILNLAADKLAELLSSSDVIFCDSRVALLTLTKATMWRGRSSRATSALFTRTPAQQPANLSHACRQRESVSVLELSCCAFVRDAAVQRNCSSNSVAVAALRERSVRQTRPSNISCASQSPGYADIRRRLCNTYAQLGLPHLSPEHMLFPSANVATLRRAFHALLDCFGDADLFTRL
ncbi:hypothetical protein MRX96_021183 [Rhipicephalus microplus]